MIIIIILGLIVIGAFFITLCSIASTTPRNIDQEWEDHLQFMHEYYEAQQRKKIKVRGK